MDLFSKASRVAKNVGTSIYSSTKEQSELAGLRVQAAVVEKQLDAHYMEIGKKYMEYVQNCETDMVFDVKDIMEQMQPDLEKLAEIKLQIAEKEEEIKKNNQEREKKKAVEEFETVKKKLDKALEMEIITELEYSIKLDAAQKKLDNFDELRKIEMQYEMDIITKSEYDEKIKSLIG